MNKIIKIILALMIALFANLGVSAEYPTVDVYVDGEILVSDQAAIIYNDRTMVPLRAIGTTLECEVDWDGETRTASISKGDTTVFVEIGSSNIVKMNGIEQENITTDAPAIIYNDRTLIPLRAVSGAFDAQAEWDSENRCVYITTNASNKTRCGILTENGYESKTLGIRFTAPEGCYVATKQEMKELLGYSGDLTNEEYQDESSASYLELLATYESGTNLNMGAVTAPSVSAEEYALEMINVLNDGVSQYISFSVSEEIETVNVAAKEFKKISAVAVTVGVEMVQDYYVGKVDDELIIMTVTYNSAEDEQAKALLDAVTAY